MIKIYHKTATIKAEQFDEAKWHAIYNDFHTPEEWDVEARKLGIDHYHGYFIIPTYEGDMRIHDGDWIATGENGEHWPIGNEIFQKTYMELPAIPKGVAEYIESAKQDEEVTNVIIAAMGAIEFDQSNIVVSEWIQANGDDFAQAWLTGYTTMEG